MGCLAIPVLFFLFLESQGVSTVPSLESQGIPRAFFTFLSESLGIPKFLGSLPFPFLESLGFPSFPILPCLESLGIPGLPILPLFWHP